MRSRSVFVAGCLTGAGCLAWAGMAGAEPRHGLSTLGDLKYPATFSHFDYVNPAAPKGGEVRLGYGEGSFDNLNPYIVKGIRLRGMGEVLLTLPFESLMAASRDEPDSMYGLVAETAEVAPDRSAVTFTLRPQARWHDGSPITAADVVFSYETLRDKGAPQFREQYRRNFDSVTVSAPNQVTFTFRKDAVLRDLPPLAAGMPILPKAYYDQVEFDRTTLEPPLGSGPYRITEATPGRSITFQRVPDYWGHDLAVNRGRWNFGKIRLEFYRDRTVEFEAFKSGEFDFREEFTSKRWATEYDFPAIKDGRVKRETIPNEAPASRQWFILNLRRDKFADRRVREAFNLAFDFEWTNKNLFYGIYERSQSIFQNSVMAARTPPGEAELDLLAPYRDRLPAALFTDVWRAPATDGSGVNRTQLARARDLLTAAGWTIRNGKLRNARNEAFEIEYLMDEPTFERIFAPVAKNLERLGIEARMRHVDSSQYFNRLKSFDFDVITSAFATPMTPGVSERVFWGSEFAHSEGSLNYAGVSDPVVDDLLTRLANAPNRSSLEVAARALDRVVLWNHYVVPQWFRASDLLAYWDMFSRPAVKPKFDDGFLDTWWLDKTKAARLERDRRP
ncbi:MAG: ABC transporter substrate-binding protein [Alphaproteobacteria bacterium]|nr:ABC transporter substrate-binding protein [Alphaproteobacteria bacterium]